MGSNITTSVILSDVIMNKNKEKRFAFGKNWKAYISTQFNDETYKQAEHSLLNFLDDFNLKGKSVLDMGCGSGIHSLVFARSGASSIVSVDYDEDSVECAQSVAHSEKNNVSWVVKQGSLLDDVFVDSLGKFDLVYCWGVAHHTGDMWKALQNLAVCVKPNGLLYIAIYNTVPGRLGSSYWYRIKKLYVSVPRLIQIIMEWIYFFIHIVKMLLTFRNPIKVMRKYREKRGMSYRHDLNDWLGGFPYEHAKAEELFSFYKERGFELVRLKTNIFIGNNQLLLRKKN